MATNLDYLESSFRAKLLEHLFVAELLQEAWLEKSQTMEVLRAEVDNAGYDLLLNYNKVTRYVQLKSSERGNHRQQKINVRLADKPGACVICLVFQERNHRFKLEYRVFPEKICERLDLSEFAFARHTKADATGYKAERRNTCIIPGSRFTKMESTGELISWLFD